MIVTALSALADYYRDHANYEFQSKEAKKCAEEMQRVLEEVRNGDLAGSLVNE